MYDIDFFDYQKKPFSQTRRYGIHPLDDNGLHKYFFSKESYTQKYLNIPTTFSSTIQTSVNQDQIEQTKDSVYSKTIQQTDVRETETKNGVESNAKSKLAPIKQKYKITNKNLPSINKRKNFALRSSGTVNKRYGMGHHICETDIGNSNEGGLTLNKGRSIQKRKLKLPEIMRMTKPPELTIRSISYYNKCMGEKYDPTCMLVFTSTNVGRNFVGAKYQH